MQRSGNSTRVVSGLRRDHNERRMTSSSDLILHPLAVALSEFDGQRTAPLEAAAQRFVPSRELRDLLVRLSTDSDIKMQTAATWLLSRWISSGLVVTSSQVAKLMTAVDTPESWLSRLHLCQGFADVAVPDRARASASRYFRRWCKDERPFVRAWAYAALARLALSAPDAMTNAKVLEFIVHGLDDPAASVRARVRRIMREWPSPARRVRGR